MSKATYEVRVEGQLEDGWSDYFEGLVMRHETVSGQIQTVIIVPAADASRLNGLLSHIGDLGLTLVSVQRTKSSGRDGPGGACRPPREG